MEPVTVAAYILLGLVALVALVIGIKAFLRSEDKASRQRALEEAQHRAAMTNRKPPAHRKGSVPIIIGADAGSAGCDGGSGGD